MELRDYAAHDVRCIKKPPVIVLISTVEISHLYNTPGSLAGVGFTAPWQVYTPQPPSAIAKIKTVCQFVTVAVHHGDIGRN